MISSILIKFGINWQNNRRDFNNLICLHFTLLYEYDCQIVLRNIETPFDNSRLQMKFVVSIILYKHLHNLLSAAV